MSKRILAVCLLAVCNWGQEAAFARQPISFTRADGSTGDDPFSLFDAARQEGVGTVGTITIDALTHSISRKGIKLMHRAENYAQSGDHSKAIAEAQQALKEPSAIPFAHGFLGAEYLKTGRVSEAVEELQQAVQLMPHDARNRSNLGYALYLAGEREQGEQEVRKALVLDSTNSKTRFVLRLIERGRGQ